MKPACYYITVLIDIQLELYQVNKCYQKKKKEEKKQSLQTQMGRIFQWRKLIHIPPNTKPKRSFTASC